MPEKFLAFIAKHTNIHSNEHIINCVTFFHIVFFFNSFLNKNVFPSFRIIDLVSHTTYVVCVNFIYKWRYLVDFEWQIFWETFHGNFILLSRVFARNLLREVIAEEIPLVFCFVVWTGTQTLAFRLISQHSIY